MSKGLQMLGGIALLFLYFIVSIGCDPSAMIADPTFDSDSTVPVADESQPSHLVMGAFNIQMFGRAKIGNSTVTTTLVDIARRFDILAVQELRSTEQTIVPRFVDMMNADGSKFNYVVGPRQGYTHQKEQYVYIFDSEKLAVTSEPYIAPVPVGEIHRSPLVAEFRCINVPAEQAFTFLLMNIHVDPDEVRTEHPALVEIIGNVRANHPNEDDLILLGDLNAPPRYFQAFPFFENQYAAIPDEWSTKTKQDLNRDNLVFDAIRTQEFTGQAGVMDLMQEYNLTMDQAAEVSDHLPVWAVFSNTEAPLASIVQDDPNVLR